MEGSKIPSYLLWTIVRIFEEWFIRFCKLGNCGVWASGVWNGYYRNAVQAVFSEIALHFYLSYSVVIVFFLLGKTRFWTAEVSEIYFLCHFPTECILWYDKNLSLSYLVLTAAGIFSGCISLGVAQQYWLLYTAPEYLLHISFLILVCILQRSGILIRNTSLQLSLLSLEIFWLWKALANSISRLLVSTELILSFKLKCFGEAMCDPYWMIID